MIDRINDGMEIEEMKTLFPNLPLLRTISIITDLLCTFLEVSIPRQICFNFLPNDNKRL